MKGFFKKAAALLMAGLMAGSMAAVPAFAEEAEDAAPEKVELNVAYMPNYASLWSVLTGMDKGYFEEEGIEIKLWEFADGPSEIAAMEGGSIDLAYIGHGAHKLCIKGQAEIFAPSSVHSTDRVIVLPSSDVTSTDDLANLKGKKVAYTAGSSSETALNGALAVAGLTIDDIDAYEMVELEFATNSVNLSSWICLPSYAEENQDILLRFSRALYKAMEFSSQPENWEYAVGLYAKQCAKDVDACMVETNDATWFSADDIRTGLEDGTISDYYQRQQQMFIDSGDVEEEVPLENYVMFDLMKEALAE